MGDFFYRSKDPTNSIKVLTTEELHLETGLEHFVTLTLFATTTRSPWEGSRYLWLWAWRV